LLDWLEFGRGPLFRFCFALMLLGLLRLAVLTAIRARNGAENAVIPKAGPRSRRPPAWGWRFWSYLRGMLLVVFHAGLIALPLFVAAHVFAWRRAVGFAWFSLPKEVSDWLAVLTVASGAMLIAMGAVDLARRRTPGRRPIWLLVLLAPVVSGYVAANAALEPDSYRALMLLHVYSGNFMLAMIPFTHVADCVLEPVARFVVRSPWRPLAEIMAFSVIFHPQPDATPGAAGQHEES
jgi:hypothetical protein